jgi:muramoyltetrapeptide carboxypeptidase
MFDKLNIHVPLFPGAHIRVINPGFPTLAFIPDRAHRAERVLVNLGFTVSYGRHAWGVSDDGTTSGTAQARASDFIEAFEDPSVHIVLAAESGCGSVDLLDHLDPASIASHVKPFIGYCDNVFLNFFLASSAGMSSLYGCTLMNHIGEAGGPFPETIEYLLRALDSSRTLECKPVVARTGAKVDFYKPELERVPRQLDIQGGWNWTRPGNGRGPLIGGEITDILELIRRFRAPLDGAILFWDVARHGLDVQPLFAQLCEEADLTRLAGMIVGAHLDIEPRRWAMVVERMLDSLLPEARYPVVVNADLSHLCPSWTVPYGELTIIDSEHGISFRRIAHGTQPRQV